MAYGYNNDYRRAGGYRPSSRYRVKRRNYKRIRNRIIIVLSGLIVCCVAVAIIVGMVRLVSGIASSCAPSATVPTATTAPASKTKNTSNAKKATEAKKTNLTFTTPKIKDDGDSTGVYDKENGLYIWNKAAFELFYGSEAKAKEYAEVVSKAKTKLGKDVNVYSLLIPNHTEMGLPSRLKNTDDGVQTDSQANYIKKSYEAMNGVEYINAYNNLADHCNDYIYFSSDHHWTGLGAYYAYEAFAKQTKQTPIELSAMKENKIEGFTGSFYGLSNEDLNKDTVNFWSMPFDVHNTVTQESGEKLETDTMYYWYEQPGDNTYGVFLFGDNPLEVIKSESETASKEKIAIIHESYGNALVPYFTANYSEVHSIDFRSFKGDLKSYCEENGIKNVLFANGVMSSATEVQLESMRGIIG
ncbi:MAG: hypothetical protein IJT79_01245 [Ruminococcus sp.]|nr:hypothetical protein [Ruminococcus sp.]